MHDFSRFTRKKEEEKKEQEVKENDSYAYYILLIESFEKSKLARGDSIENAGVVSTWRRSNATFNHAAEKNITMNTSFFALIDEIRLTGIENDRYK